MITWVTTSCNLTKLEPCCVGPPKMAGSCWRILTKKGSLEEGRPNHFCFLPLRTLLTVWKYTVQSLSHVRLFVTTWTALRQASLPITNPKSLLKLMLIELVMTANHLILCCSLLLLSQHQGLSQWVSSLHQVVKSIGASTLASALPVNVQCWFPLGLTDLILQFKGCWRVFSSTTVWKHQPGSPALQADSLVSEPPGKPSQVNCL